MKHLRLTYYSQGPLVLSQAKLKASRISLDFLRKLKEIEG